jgi:hypothetical protein
MEILVWVGLALLALPAICAVVFAIDILKELYREGDTTIILMIACLVSALLGSVMVIAGMVGSLE